MTKNDLIIYPNMVFLDTVTNKTMVILENGLLKIKDNEFIEESLIKQLIADGRIQQVNNEDKETKDIFYVRK